MFTQTLKVMCLIALVVSLSACEKLKNDKLERTLNSTELTMMDAIPREYGRLVDVAAGRDYMATLWFENTDEITVVTVNYSTGSIGPRALVIPRR